MSELLDQNEIDALLTAVDEGHVETSGEAQTQVFTRHGTTSAMDVQVRAYDFKRPDRVSKDHMRALEQLHESFSRNFGAALSGFLRTIVEVKVANIEQMTFSELTCSLPNPTCFNLLSVAPLDGSFCLEISPLITYPVLDRLLGGSNTDLFIPQRPLTAIELRLVSRIIDRACSAMQEAWAGVVALDVHLRDSESNPQLVQVVPPNEVVVVVGFELKMGSRAGTMSLCVPYNVIEPVLDQLTNQAWDAHTRTETNDRLRDQIARQLDQAKLTLSSVLADTTIRLNELLNLEAGDIIVTDKPADAPLTMLVEGKRKYVGHLGQFKGSRAFKVQRPFEVKDRV